MTCGCSTVVSLLHTSRLDLPVQVDLESAPSSSSVRLLNASQRKKGVESFGS